MSLDFESLAGQGYGLTIGGSQPLPAGYSGLRDRIRIGNTTLQANAANVSCSTPMNPNPNLTPMHNDIKMPLL